MEPPPMQIGIHQQHPWPVWAKLVARLALVVVLPSLGTAEVIVNVLNVLPAGSSNRADRMLR